MREQLKDQFSKYNIKQVFVVLFEIRYSIIITALTEPSQESVLSFSYSDHVNSVAFSTTSPFILQFYLEHGTGTVGEYKRRMMYVFCSNESKNGLKKITHLHFPKKLTS